MLGVPLVALLFAMRRFELYGDFCGRCCGHSATAAADGGVTGVAAVGAAAEGGAAAGDAPAVDAIQESAAGDGAAASDADAAKADAGATADDADAAEAAEREAKALATRKAVGIATSFLKLKFNSLQIYVGAKNAFEMRLPDEFDWWVTLLERFARLDVTAPLAPECTFGSFNFHTAMDVTYTGFVSVNVMFFVKWKYKLSLVAQRETAAGEAERVRYMWVAFNYLAYATISYTTSAAFVCDEFDDGSRWLRADRSIDCDAAAYTRHCAYAVCGIIVFVIGIPAIFLYNLYSLKQQGALADQSAFNAFHFLSGRFEPHAYWFDCPQMLVKAGFGGLLLIKDPSVKFAFGLLLAEVWGIGCAKISPFPSWQQNIAFDMLNTGLVCFLLTKLSATPSDDPNEASPLKRALLYVCSIGMFAGVLAWMGRELAYGKWRAAVQAVRDRWQAGRAAAVHPADRYVVDGGADELGAAPPARGLLPDALPEPSEPAAPAVAEAKATGAREQGSRKLSV